jgi:branched-chain amino acid transport system substrate-binding protein
MSRAAWAGTLVSVAAVCQLATAPSAPASNAAATLRVGLFLPASGEEGAVAAAIERGARLAADEVNAGGGDVRVELVPRQADLLWAAGAREVVALAYEDDVAAVIGGVGGREAHLAEQILTRMAGRVVFVTFASDPTLTEVRLPWVFRMVPDDRAQAEVLRGSLEGVAEPPRWATLVEQGDYDAAVAADQLEREGAHPPVRLAFEDSIAGRRGAVEEVVRRRIGAAVLLARPGPAARLAQALAAGAPGVRLLGPSRLACPEFLATAGPAAEGMVVVGPAASRGSRENTTSLRFYGRYRQEYGTRPPPLAAAAYDAVHAVAEARGGIRTRTQGLAATLRTTKRTGASGLLQFDGAGNRVGAPPLLVIRDGTFAPLP